MPPIQIHPPPIRCPRTIASAVITSTTIIPGQHLPEARCPMIHPPRHVVLEKPYSSLSMCSRAVGHQKIDECPQLARGIRRRSGKQQVDGTLGCCHSGSRETSVPFASSSWHSMAGREASPSPQPSPPPPGTGDVVDLGSGRGSTSTSRSSSSKTPVRGEGPR